MKCRILWRAREVATKFSQSRLGVRPDRGDHLHDVAAPQARAQRHHAPVHPRPDARVPHVGVHGVGEVDRRGAARQRLDLALRREGVHLLRIQVELQAVDELARVAGVLLGLEQLAQPVEVLLVGMGAHAALLVLPVGGDALLGHLVHALGADLHLEREAAIADDRRVQRLVAVGARHGDEVLEAAGDGGPGLVDDPQRGVAVADGRRDDPERDQVVDLVEADLLPAQLLADAEQPLDSPLEGQRGDPRLAELVFERRLEPGDGLLRGAAALLHPGPQALERGRIEMPERELLELVLELAHPQPVGDGGVDVQRLLGDLQAPLLPQVAERAHVVQAVGQLDEDDADVVDHRQQHLAEVLGLALLARREGDGADLRHPLDHVRHLGAEQVADVVDGGERVLDDVVEQAGRDGDVVEAHLGDQRGHLEGVGDVLLPRAPGLAGVLEGRELVGAAQQIRVGVGIVRAHAADEVVEADHRASCRERSTPTD